MIGEKEAMAGQEESIRRLRPGSKKRRRGFGSSIIPAGPLVIWDETLRDGEQAPGVAFSADQKVELARMLDTLCVGVIDAGFPSVSVEERESVRRIRDSGLSAVVGATVRAKSQDVALAEAAGIRNLFMFAPTSDIHISTKFEGGRSKLAATILEAVRYSADRGLRVYFISEDSSRTDLGFLCDLIGEIHREGVRDVIITDTIGLLTPMDTREMIGAVKRLCPSDCSFGIHCHNDFGLATANTLAALEMGVTYATVTVNGIGERTGNASLEETVAALETIYGCCTGVDLGGLTELSRKVETFSGMPLSAHKAVVGFNAFRHESGIHVKAMLKNPRAYEILDPETVGATRALVLGKHSGRAAVRQCLEQEEIFVDEDRIAGIVQSVKGRVASPDLKRFIATLMTLYYTQHLGLSPKGLGRIVRGEEHP